MRALLLRLLWRAFGPVPAFAVAALVFGALHLANPGATALAGVTVAVAGLMFCALYALTGRLWVPIGLHLAWNFAQGYLFGAAVSGGDLGGSIAVSTARPGAAAWLTGGSFGPEASVFALLLVGSVTVGALSLARNARPGSSVHRLRFGESSGFAGTMINVLAVVPRSPPGRLSRPDQSRTRLQPGRGVPDFGTVVCLPSDHSIWVMRGWAVGAIVTLTAPSGATKLLPRSRRCIYEESRICDG